MPHKFRTYALAAAALMATMAATRAAPADQAPGGTPAAGAQMDPDAYTLDVQDVSIPVGTQSALRVTLRPRDGYRILDAYNNRIIMLSSYDGDVAFAHKMVPGAVRDGALVFDVGVTPTAPGSHAINGVVRVGYIHGPEEMAMVSMKLIAKVTGTK